METSNPQLNKILVLYSLTDIHMHIHEQYMPSPNSIVLYSLQKTFTSILTTAIWVVLVEKAATVICIFFQVDLRLRQVTMIFPRSLS